MSFDRNSSCWICECENVTQVKVANIPSSVTAKDFTITDDHYGFTASIYQCQKCGFMQCHDMGEVLPFYEELEDSLYEQGRPERTKMARDLLKSLQNFQPCGRLLDIGAGSGMLVEEALKMGYQAEGVEPSRYLHGLAQEHKLPVQLGAFPHVKLNPPYDIITLVDVIEHFPNPMHILSQVNTMLSDTGVGLVTTPDVGSFFARIMGFNWWHYRTAHIGYFDLKTLTRALTKSGLKPLKVSRPGWYFSLDYLTIRLNKILPSLICLPVPKILGKFTVPLNLFDSLLIVFKKEEML